MLFGAIRLLEYILLKMEQIAWVSRWFVLKETILSNVFVSRSLLLDNVCFVPVPLQRAPMLPTGSVPNSTKSVAKARLGTTSDLIWTMLTPWLTQYNRWMVSFDDTICYVSKIIWQKNSNLMILDNYGIDYSRILLFVLGFLVYWKIEPNSHAFSRIRTDNNF